MAKLCVVVDAATTYSIVTNGTVRALMVVDGHGLVTERLKLTIKL